MVLDNQYYTQESGSKILKIGYSKGLKKRLDSYQTAYQSSFYTWLIIITDNEKHARELEKIMHGFLTWMGHQYFHEEYKPRTNPEWFEVKNTEYIRLFIEGLVTHIIGLGVTEIINMHPNIKNSMVRKTKLVGRNHDITVTNAEADAVARPAKNSDGRGWKPLIRLLPKAMKKYENEFQQIKNYILQQK